MYREKQTCLNITIQLNFLDNISRNFWKLIWGLLCAFYLLRHDLNGHRVIIVLIGKNGTYDWRSLQVDNSAWPTFMQFSTFLCKDHKMMYSFLFSFRIDFKWLQYLLYLQICLLYILFVELSIRLCRCVYLRVMVTTGVSSYY